MHYHDVGWWRRQEEPTFWASGIAACFTPAADHAQGGVDEAFYAIRHTLDTYLSHPPHLWVEFCEPHEIKLSRVERVRPTPLSRTVVLIRVRQRYDVHGLLAAGETMLFHKVASVVVPVLLVAPGATYDWRKVEAELDKAYAFEMGKPVHYPCT